MKLFLKTSCIATSGGTPGTRQVLGRAGARGTPWLFLGAACSLTSRAGRVLLRAFTFSLSRSLFLFPHLSHPLSQELN